MSCPTYDQLIEPIFKAIHALGGSASIEELEEKVADMLQLTDEQLSEIHKNSQTKFSYRLAWARTYLKKFGVITNSSRGVWALTSEGQRRTSVSKKEVTHYVKKMMSEVKTDDTATEIEPEETKEIQWQDHVLDVIKSISPDAFERLCQRLLRESGFTSVEVTGKVGDGGIDGRGIVRLGGLLSFYVFFQCKRYQGAVSSSTVRDFRGAMAGRADKGLLITTGTFTSSAKKEAQRDGAQPIDLIDGDDLVKKLKELEMGICVKQKVIEKIVIDEAYFNNI